MVADRGRVGLRPGFRDVPLFHRRGPAQKTAMSVSGRRRSVTIST